MTRDMAPPPKQDFAPGEFVRRWLTVLQEDRTDGRCEWESTSIDPKPRPGDVEVDRSRRLPRDQSTLTRSYQIDHNTLSTSPVRKKRRRDQSDVSQDEVPREQNDVTPASKHGTEGREFPIKSGPVMKSPGNFQPKSLSNHVSSSGSLASNESALPGDCTVRNTCLEADEKDPTAKYARRPRHKTRLDRYEYKANLTKENATNKKCRGKTRRRRMRNKISVSLNQEFEAPNIAQGRLTLRSSNGLGFFDKGKASSPVPRRGLPDLTFSEMTFLSKPKRIENMRQQKLKDGKSCAKTRGSARVVSEFFSKPSLKRCRAIDVGPKCRSDSTPSTSSAPHGRSTISLDGLERQKTWRELKYRRSVHQTLVSAESADEGISNAAWSVTPRRTSAREAASESTSDPESSQQPLSQHVAIESDHEVGGRAIPPGLQDPKAASNARIDELAKCVLLDDHKTSFAGLAKVPMQGEYYTLDDLKNLAQVEGTHYQSLYRDVLGIHGLPENFQPPLLASRGKNIGNERKPRSSNVPSAANHSTLIDLGLLSPQLQAKSNFRFPAHVGHHSMSKRLRRAVQSQHGLDSTPHQNPVQFKRPDVSATVPINPQDAGWILNTGRPRHDSRYHHQPAIRTLGTRIRSKPSAPFLTHQYDSQNFDPRFFTVNGEYDLPRFDPEMSSIEKQLHNPNIGSAFDREVDSLGDCPCIVNDHKQPRECESLAELESNSLNYAHMERDPRDINCHGEPCRAPQQGQMGLNAQREPLFQCPRPSKDSFGNFDSPIQPIADTKFTAFSRPRLLY